MKWKNNKAYEIHIPHLSYTVKYGKNEKEFKGRYSTSIMITENTDRSTATIFFRKEPTAIQSAIVAHEIMHVLQYICKNRNIVMEEEMEHMGYLMQYIHGKIYGYKLSIPR